MSDILTIPVRVRPRPQCLYDLPAAAFHDHAIHLNTKDHDEALRIIRRNRWNLLITTDYGHEFLTALSGAYVTEREIAELIVTFQKQWDQETRRLREAARDGKYPEYVVAPWILQAQKTTYELVDLEAGDGQ